MRHYDEDMIDFPVSDVFRDQFAAQGLTYDSGRYRPTPPAIAPTPRGGHSEADGSGWQRVGELIDVLHRKQQEIDRLKSGQALRTDSRDSFEGVE